ncbi:SIR2 family NAD-dependent protein deacylase [Rhodospira trueperi]
MAVTVRDRPALIAEVANCIDAENFDPSKAHKELKDLPWAYFVTTNYDDLLNKDNKFRSIITEDLYLWEGVHSVKKLIYAIHGNLDNPHTLTREDYRCWGERNPRASRRLEDTLFNRTVLFVGYSISDPNFGDILNRVKRIMGDKSLTQKGLAPGLGA